MSQKALLGFIACHLPLVSSLQNPWGRKFKAKQVPQGTEKRQRVSLNVINESTWLDRTAQGKVTLMSQESIHTSCVKSRAYLQTRIYSYYSSLISDLLQLQTIQDNFAVLSLRFWTCATLFKLDALSVEQCNTSGQSLIKFVQARAKESGCPLKHGVFPLSPM